MARVLVTGSSDGLGLLSGKLLAEQGHSVSLHARSEKRAADAIRALPKAERVLVGDFATLAGMRAVAEQANASGTFDAVIHNAGIGYRLPKPAETVDGLQEVFAVNVLAPYVLTAAMHPSSRLIYLSSGLHRGGSADVSDLQWKKRPWDGMQAYSDSKLLDVLLAFGVARRRPNVFSNAVHPGWVPTKMGGRGAPDDLELGADTQAWLAVSDDAAAKVTGKYFFHRKEGDAHSAARDTRAQDALFAICEEISGLRI